MLVAQCKEYTGLSEPIHAVKNVTQLSSMTVSHRLGQTTATGQLGMCTILPVMPLPIVQDAKSPSCFVCCRITCSGCNQEHLHNKEQPCYALDSCIRSAGTLTRHKPAHLSCGNRI